MEKNLWCTHRTKFFGNSTFKNIIFFEVRLIYLPGFQTIFTDLINLSTFIKQI